jgi:hypothetical protein
MPEREIIESVLDIRSEEQLRDEHLFNQLADAVNRLIQQDFNKLISILYRIDVSESKLRELLRTHPDKEAGRIIASLLVERQMQKIRTRRQSANPELPADDPEKW